MRNLVLLQDQCSNSALRNPLDDGAAAVNHLCLDIVDGSMYTANCRSIVQCHSPPTAPVRTLAVRHAYVLLCSNHYALMLLDLRSQARWAINLGQTTPSSPAGIASMAHVPELEALFLALDTGELVLIHTGSQAIEEVHHAWAAGMRVALPLFREKPKPYALTSL